jgi:hypothetical protein
MFLIFSAIFIDIIIELLLNDVILNIPVIFFLIITAIVLFVSLFIFPNYVIIEYGQLTFVYFLGFKKTIYFSEIEEYDIDTMLYTISLKVRNKNSFLDFFYSPQELDPITDLFKTYKIRKRDNGS